MREERLAIGGAIITAFVASLCCIGPLVSAVLCLGAFGPAGAFETARPHFLGLAVLILAFGFYRAYFRRAEACAPGEACAAKPVNKASRVGLWIASIAVLAFALSPYYVGYIATALAHTQRPSTPPIVAPANQATSAEASLETLTVQVEGMSCTACEVPVRDALAHTPGVRTADVSFKRGDARVEFDLKQTSVEQIKRAINSTGYKVK